MVLAPYHSGFTGFPDMNVNHALAKETLDISSLQLYSNDITTQESSEIGELFPYEEENHESRTIDDEDDDVEQSINLMVTSESESEDEYTTYDLSFLNDKEGNEDELSFYRALDNEI